VTTISWLNAVDGDWSNSADWSGGSVPGSTDSVLINQLGTYAVTITQPEAITGLTLGAAGASLNDTATLALGASILLNAGTLDVAGQIVGGTIAGSGGVLVGAMGTLDHTVLSGSISLSGNLYIANYTTFDNVALYALGDSRFSVPYVQDIASTLTLGPNFSYIVDGARSPAIGFSTLGGPESTATGSSLVNEGAISAVNGGGLDIFGNALYNSGVIDITSGGYSYIDVGFVSGSAPHTAFSNSGSITVSYGVLGIDLLSDYNPDTGTYFPSLLSNTGDITVTEGGVLLLNLTTTTAALGNIHANAGAVVLREGTLFNVGSTLNIGVGSTPSGTSTQLGELDLSDSTIVGGTIIDSGQGLGLAPPGLFVDVGGRVLDGVVYDGTLDLSANNLTLEVLDGISLHTTPGSATGLVKLLGGNSALYFAGATTLDHTTIQLGNSLAAATLFNGVPHSDYATDIPGAPLALGSDLTIIQAGKQAAIDSTNKPGDGITNNGTIIAAFSGGTLTIAVANFTNVGTVLVNNETLKLDTPGLVNTGVFIVTTTDTLDIAGSLSLQSLGSISGSFGTFHVEAGATLDLNGATLRLGDGEPVGNLLLDGVVSNGTIEVDAGGSLTIGIGHLSNVTLRGSELAGTDPILAATRFSVDAAASSPNYGAAVSDLYNVMFGLGATEASLLGGTIDEKRFLLAVQNSPDPVTQVLPTNVLSDLGTIAGDVANGGQTSYSDTQIEDIVDNYLLSASDFSTAFQAVMRQFNANIAALKPPGAAANAQLISIADAAFAFMVNLRYDVATFNQAPITATSSAPDITNDVRFSALHSFSELGDAWDGLNLMVDMINLASYLSAPQGNYDQAFKDVLKVVFDLVELALTVAFVLNPATGFPLLVIAAILNIGAQHIDGATGFIPGGWGDIHLTTLSGLKYDFQAVGEFILTQSKRPNDTFEVQVRLQPFNGSASVSVATQVAVQLGTDRITFGESRASVLAVNGVAAALTAANPLLILNGGAVLLVAANTYAVFWTTGEFMEVIDNKDYFSIDTVVSPDAGATQGLLGGNGAQANDFTLRDGTVLTQPLTDAQLYGDFANSWRISQSESLLDYNAGETTATFTDQLFPTANLSLTSFPTALVQNAQQLAAAAGITDPALSAAAVLDYLASGDIAVFTDAQARQSANPATSAVITSTDTAAAELGVAAVAPSITEADQGTTAASFTIFLTGVATRDIAVRYAVTDPGTGYLGPSAFGGMPPSGEATIGAGQTTATVSITLPNAILGATPRDKLQIQITAVDDTPVFNASAETNIINNQPHPGPSAAAKITEVTDIGTFSQTGTISSLHLGEVTFGQMVPDMTFAIGNSAPTGADDLGGSFTFGISTGYTIVGAETLMPIAVGMSYTGLTVDISTTVVGYHSVTIVYQPTDQNGTGYSANLPQQTLTIDATVLPCFAAGTLIATSRGDVRVELLQIDDLVQTQFGGMAPIKWIGHRRVDCSHHLKPCQVWPVCIRADAFDDGMPRQNLWLSPDHAIFVNDVLIPIKYLINGTSIEQMTRDEVTYYHIELPQHDVLLAEGMLAESYLDTGDRSNFGTGDGVMRLFPDFSARGPDVNLIWEAYGCAPLVVTGHEFETVRKRLEERARLVCQKAHSDPKDAHADVSTERATSPRRTNRTPSWGARMNVLPS
jgi:Hint domain/von Willebrand factor type D domain